MFRPTSLTRTGPRAAGTAFGCSGERGACRPSLDDSAIAAHRIALADPFGRLGSLACSAKRRHLGRVAGRPPKQLLAVSEKPDQLLAVPKSRGACRPPLDGSAIAAHRIALAVPFGRLGSLACSTKRRHLDRVAGLPPKQLLAVSEKLGADFASLDGFALRFTSHRLRRPLQAADSLAWSSVVPYTACRGAQSKQLVAVSKEPESFAALCSYRRQKLVVIKHLYPTALRKQLAAVSEGRNSFRLFGVGR
ncbi:hypothetical protein ACIUZ9_32760 [Pseudomonas aeruginosa]